MSNSNSKTQHRPKGGGNQPKFQQQYNQAPPPEPDTTVRGYIDYTKRMYKKHPLFMFVFHTALAATTLYALYPILGVLYTLYAMGAKIWNWFFSKL